MIVKARSTKHEARRGYTLIELIVAIGLFSIVMTLATGAYLIMINVNRQTQGLATGINNLAFVLESMTTAMRTGSAYCSNGDCVEGGSGSTFSFRNQSGAYVTYDLDEGEGTVKSCQSPTAFCTPITPLTAPAVKVTSLSFWPSGIEPESAGDTYQPYVTITISGIVTVAPSKTQVFSVESSVIMRGSDI